MLTSDGHMTTVKSNLHFMIIIAVFLLAGCTVADEQSTPTAAASTATRLLEPTPTPSPTDEPSSSPSPTATQETLPTSTTSATAHPTMTATPEPLIIDDDSVECVAPLSSPIDREDPLLARGSILLGSPIEPGIWLLSGTGERTKVAPEGRPSLSPDRTKIAYQEFGGDREMHIYDLTTGQEIQQFLVPEDWRGLLGWQDEENVLFYGNFERQRGEGWTSKYHRLNIYSLEAEEVSSEVSLPGFTFHHMDIPGFAFTSQPPKDSSTWLYTAFMDDDGFVYVLQNTEENQELWRKSVYNSSGHVPPDWTNDGQHAVLVLPRSPEKPFDEIISLSRDGQETEVLARVTGLQGLEEDLTFHAVSWSPDARYIYFSIHEFGYLGEEQHPGYILDTQTGRHARYVSRPS